MLHPKIKFKADYRKDVQSFLDFFYNASYDEGRSFQWAVTDHYPEFKSFEGKEEITKKEEKEIIRECEEEIHQKVEVVTTIGTTKEFRNRDAKEYTTTCFLVKAVGEVDNDTRTEDERNNGLRVEWVEKERLKKIFEDQNKQIDEEKIDFYNTAFNIRRDTEFLKEYFKNNS
jgi:ADP-ribose pyrophosphatase YjhB (NUDIX family)